MRDIRRRWFSRSVWVPLRVSATICKTGEAGQPGFSEEWFGLGCVAVPTANRAEAEKLGWMDIGISHDGGPFAFKDGRYKPCESFQHDEGVDLGISLVFEQHITGHPSIWHLNQDVVLALGLLNEGDVWVRPDEDYREVIRQQRGADGRVVAIEMHSEYLRDYLAARGMALRLAHYRTRRAVFDFPPSPVWPPDGLLEESQNERFVTRVYEIDEGGGRFGGDVAVFKAWRTDADPEEDVPVFGPPDGTNTDSESYTYTRAGRKLLRVEGELWRQEWIDPGDKSERVRGDAPADLVSFIVDQNGARMDSRVLNDEDIGRYLWFEPRVISALAERRGGALTWYTRDTGGVRCTHGVHTHFGINRIGLINAYAFDVARRPQWQQRIWAAHNVAPDGGVSAELLMAQMEAQPADTHAPEEALPQLFKALDELFDGLVGSSLFRPHHATDDIARGIHRFRAVESKGLLALAKDIARLTADRLDVGSLRKVIQPSADQTWRSLKHLQCALETVVPPTEAREIVSPLVGVYELRLGDAHLPASDFREALRLARVDPKAGAVEQGRQLLEGVVGALDRVGAAFAHR
ncbi:hypothetical protein [Hyphomicrobium sp. 1Nfss2.1]|uniref:hypothetical protein n=1 Tax=Hyphomicrobium sp. 1Nfss2.1 TaxID=3413936 RepID=UPI003C7D7861